MKKILSLFLLMLIGLNAPVFAVPNYTYTRTVQETYAPAPNYVQQSAYEEYQEPYYQDVNYSVPQVPNQGYTKSSVLTETMRDETPAADKAISRAWGVTGILAVLGLVAMGIVGVSTSNGGHHRPPCR